MEVEWRPLNLQNSTQPTLTQADSCHQKREKERSGCRQNERRRGRQANRHRIRQAEICENNFAPSKAPMNTFGINYFTTASNSGETQTGAKPENISRSFHNNDADLLENIEAADRTNDRQPLNLRVMR